MKPLFITDAQASREHGLRAAGRLEERGWSGKDEKWEQNSQQEREKKYLASITCLLPYLDFGWD
jgi:hypothetical protein